MRARLQIRSTLWLAVAACAAMAGPAAAEEVATGSIKSYECGDNCYLTIAISSGQSLTGLCAAAECQGWNEQAAIPANMVGAKVRVTVGSRQQRDSAGNVMGTFPAFTDIVFDN